MSQHLGICEWSLPVSGITAFKVAAQCGYEGLQIGEAGGRSMGYPLNSKFVQEIYKGAAEHCGVKLNSMNLGALLSEGTMNYAPETTEGQWAKKSLEKGFEAARELGIHTIVITVEPREDNFDNLVKHVNFADKLAKDSDVEIALEFGTPQESIDKFLAAVTPDAKVCMDLLNPLRFGVGDPIDMIKAIGKDKISHFHMKDSSKDLFKKGVRGCTLLGEGDAKYHESVELIKAMGFDDMWMITENYYMWAPMNSGEDDFVALAAKDLQTMKKSFGL